MGLVLGLVFGLVCWFLACCSSSFVVVVRALLLLVLRPCSFVCWLCCVSSVVSFVGSWPFLCCLSVLGWCVCVFVVGVGFGCFGFWFGCAVGFAGLLCQHRDLLTIALPPIEWPGYACSNVRQLYSRAVRVERKKGLGLDELLVPPPEEGIEVVARIDLMELPQHLRLVAPLEGHHLSF